jgi:manganese efflux pump family protein
MEIVALITWLIAAAFGAVMFRAWRARGEQGTTRIPANVIFGHFLLAGTGLVVWIIYVIADVEALTWVALILLLLVAVLGFTMFARWLPSYQARANASGGDAPVEGGFNVSVVALHGLFAVVTLVLVLLTALGVGES